ncbi:MAG: tyrosine-type recombinase/integrase [Streptosporangiaceae bacterium]
MTCLDRDTVVARSLAPPFTLEHPASRRQRRRLLINILDWLQAQPGRTWQDRWNASGVDTSGRATPDWKDIPAAWIAAAGRSTDPQAPRYGLNAALLQLICGDVVRPSIPWLLTARSHMNLAREMARVRDPDDFAALRAASRRAVVSDVTEDGAVNRVSYILAAKGGALRDITVGDCLELLDLAYEYGEYHSGGTGPHFYQMLHATGIFPDSAPTTVRMLGPSRKGQLTPAQLIDRYDLACHPVRDLLVDYLSERQPALDYTSLMGLANHLGLRFWKDLEEHHPGISSLDLAPDVAAAWKQRARTKPAGPGSGSPTGRVPRLSSSGCLVSVRALYLDIAQWAAEDPARWGRWAVRCPIRPADIAQRRELGGRKSRMGQRTRERLPALPKVATALDQARADAAALLETSRQVGDREYFTANGQVMRRLILPSSEPRIWAEDTSGVRHDLTREEDRAFWAWAAVEILRHTGIRVEELTELSHHSLVQHRTPATGELVPLLHIAPSKTDQERLLVISPQLADVLATILQRVRTRDGAVPLVASYDRERTWNPPMPVLFQHPVGMDIRPFTPGVIQQLLSRVFETTGAATISDRPLKFTPHDFRRIFATEAMLNGMPPHIAQLLLGHADINVTMGYKAVYPEEAIAAHRAFIARRRQLRPSEEYRTPTDEEWDEFLGHFQRRRLSLGDCGRAWGTTCIHEHACIRCPLLRVDPAQRPRLESIHQNLVTRLTEAEHEGWAGEAEGIKISLTAATAKLAQADGLAARRAVASPDTPGWSDIAPRTAVMPENWP